jgi:hypothetical protein
MRTILATLALGSPFILACSHDASENESTLMSRPAPLVGGQPVKAGEFPATVHVWGNCTAAKVGPRHILLAAHCVYDGTGIDKSWQGPVYITSNPQFVDTLNDDPRLGYVEVTAERIDVHPSWVASSGFNQADFEGATDLAVVFLADGAPLAALPVAGLDFELVKAGDEVIIMGYGCERGSKVPSDVDPRLTSFQTAENGEVEDADADWLTRIERGIGLADGPNPRVMHTPGKMNGGASICPGDSGGPVYRVANRQIVGVNSFGGTRLWDFDGVGGLNGHARLTFDSWLKDELAR